MNPSHKPTHTILRFLCLSILSLGLFSNHAVAKVLKQTCEKFDDPVPWSYCITETKGSQNEDVLYFIHGLGMDRYAWSVMGNEIRLEWARAKKDAPKVVTFSFGKLWILAKRNSSDLSGLYEIFEDVIVPYVEAKLGGVDKIRRRLLFGFSMGGFNGVQLYLKRPDMFDRVVIACPAIYPFSPFVSEETVDDFIKKSGALDWKAKYAIQTARSYYPSEAEWNEADPFIAGLRDIGPWSPPLHISCGDRDNYGFFEGTRLFSEFVKARGVKEVVWQPIAKRGHCAFKHKSIAAFLAK